MKIKGGREIITILLLLTFFVGCAKSPNKISASYVSPLQYQSYTCDQIGEELLRVNRKVLEVSGQQKSEATKDAVAMTVGLVIFWPALFFLMGSDKQDELARLKGEYDALEITAIKKECSIASELQEARKQREKDEEERKIESVSTIEGDCSGDDC